MHLWLYKFDQILYHVQKQQQQLNKFETDLEDIKNTRKPFRDNANRITMDETNTEDKEIIILLVSSRSMEEMDCYLLQKRSCRGVSSILKLI